MAYCLYTDVQLETGTSLGTITTDEITSRILQSDKEIAGRLKREGLTAPTVATDDLKTASIHLTVAWAKRRQAHELSRPNSLSIGGDLSFSTQPETEAVAEDLKAEEAILAYIASVNGSGFRTSRVRSRCR
jgi:hypothetical protein